jgi:hypothetical protein
MNAETVAETYAGARGDEGGAPPVGHLHDAAAGHGEGEIVGALAVDRARQLDGDEPGNRDGTGLMRFVSAQDDAPADVGEGALTSMRWRSKSMSQTRRAVASPQRRRVWASSRIRPEARPDRRAA